MISSEVLIIGAGVSGLGAALALRERGIGVTILEANSFVGGAAQTVQREGYLCEKGPNTIMLSNPATVGFLQNHGLMDSALEASPRGKKRFIVQNGELVALPISPFGFFSSKIISWKAKFRLLQEPFIPRGKDENESLAGFVRRRLGEELLREMVDPFVSGVYAGDPERLLVRHAMPKLHALEQKYGSLIRGSLEMRGRTAPKGGMYSWKGGLAEFCSSLAVPLKGSLHLSAPIHKISRKDKSYLVETGAGEFEAKKIVMATDAGTVARLLGSLVPDIGTFKTLIHSPICVLHLGFPKNGVKHPLDGFGVLISRNRGIRTLGALFSSSLFPHRAPEGHVLLTVFIGGRLDPDAMMLDDSSLLRIALDDLGPLLKIQSPPAFQMVTRWPRAIPQYEKDHSKIIEACERIEKALPGLYLLGNYRGGISMSDCLGNGISLGKNL